MIGDGGMDTGCEVASDELVVWIKGGDSGRMQVDQWN